MFPMGDRVLLFLSGTFVRAVKDNGEDGSVRNRDLQVEIDIT